MAKLSTQGVELRIGDGASSETFTKLAQVQGFSGLGSTRTEIDATDLDSEAFEFVMGLADSGNITATVHFDPKDSQQDSLFIENQAASPELKNYQVGFDNGSPESTVTFAAYVQGFEVDIQTDSLIQATVTFRVSGAYTKENWAT